MHVFINPLSRFLVLFSTLFFSLYALPAWAEVAGYVAEIQGVVTKSHNITLNKGDSVDSSDKITTSKDSKVRLKMIDEGIVELGANTEIQLVTYHYNNKKMNNALKIKILKGFFRTESGEIGKDKDDQYSISTPLVNIGVQGTAYKVKVTEQAEFIGVDKGTILLEEEFNMLNLAAERQTTRLGAQAKNSFIRLPKLANVRGFSSEKWEEFATKPDDFPEEFQ